MMPLLIVSEHHPRVPTQLTAPDIFWQLTYGGTKYPTYTYVRKNTNYNSPVTDLASNDLRLVSTFK